MISSYFAQVAYELPGEPSEIQAYRRHGHVYLLTVGDRQYVAKMGIDWSDQDIRFKLGVQTYLHDIGYPDLQASLHLQG